MRGPQPLAVALVAAAVLLAACATRGALEPGSTAAASYLPDLRVSRAPFEEVHADWKERLPQRYVFLEHHGSYTETGSLLPRLAAALNDAGIGPSGPPFGLYYDDPGSVPVAELRSRACFPVSTSLPGDAPLGSDTLPSCTVVYAIVAGAYPEIPRAYPGLYAYMGRMGWVENGPVREIYLTPPGSVHERRAAGR